MEAYLLVEHSHSDPEARYSLYDAKNWEKIDELLDSEGWVNENVPTLILDGKMASYNSPIVLMQEIKQHGLKIKGEANSWMDHD